MASLPHNSIRHDVQYKRPVATWPPMRVSLVCCSVVWYPRYSILIVDTYVTILVSPRSRYTAVYCSSTKYRETAQVSRVSTIPCSSYHLATCTLQACDAKTNSKVAENHNYHRTTMSAWAAVNKYNPISYFCTSAALLTTLTNIDIEIALRISGIAVVSSIAIPETVLLSSLQFQVSHNTGAGSVWKAELFS